MTREVSVMITLCHQLLITLVKQEFTNDVVLGIILVKKLVVFMIYMKIAPNVAKYAKVRSASPNMVYSKKSGYICLRFSKCHIHISECRTDKECPASRSRCINSSCGKDFCYD